MDFAFDNDGWRQRSLAYSVHSGALGSRRQLFDAAKSKMPGEVRRPMPTVSIVEQGLRPNTGPEQSGAPRRIMRCKTKPEDVRGGLLSGEAVEVSAVHSEALSTDTQEVPQEISTHAELRGEVHLEVISITNLGYNHRAVMEREAHISLLQEHRLRPAEVRDSSKILSGEGRSTKSARTSMDKAYSPCARPGGTKLDRKNNRRVQ